MGRHHRGWTCWAYQSTGSSKLTSIAYCNLLKLSLVPLLDYIPLSLPRDFVVMHDNAPSHSALATQAFLTSFSIQCEKLMMWQPCSAICTQLKTFALSSNETFIPMDVNLR